ncbi:hypothetical protein KQH49_07290 [Mycetohabitans sp. B5]|uniref:Alpha/beta hydrolase family protein DUF900 n=1 Tax=Mycetohabitans endofungorum TaxID=417203 RepID=A0A2P5KAV2_9BURK|nr:MULTISPECIES: hypothetical protein [Mycetohabitans]MCG1054770.1 hypothetical protein [Mycetohabitans sp. B5]PPB83827.1 hypothetical protein B0O95_1058 [Mycetohabitans endofungorum]
MRRSYKFHSDQQRKARRAQVASSQDELDSSVRLVSWLEMDPDRPFKGAEAISKRLYNGSQEIHTTNLEIGHDKSIPKDKKAPVSEATQKQLTKGVIGIFSKRRYLNRPPNFIGPSEQPDNGIETILIHGTFSGTAAEVGWTRPDGKHADIVRKNFGGKVTALQWSGKNHKLARIEAGQTLAKKIDENTRAGIITNVIAHSHGGNVAFEAIKQTQGNIKQLVTLGTPIRRDHLPLEEKLREKVEHYIHISGGKDTTAPIGGVDCVRSFKNCGKKMGVNNAKIKNALANTQLHVVDADHSELHSEAVLGLITAITRAT